MKLKLISNGTASQSKVVNMETGEEIENVKKITWTMNALDCSFLIMEVSLVSAEVELIDPTLIVKTN